MQPAVPVVLLLTLSSCLCLHIQSHSTSQTYLSTLRSQQSSLTDQISALKSSLSRTQSTLAQ